MYTQQIHTDDCPKVHFSLVHLPASPSGKKFRSKPQLARYLGNQMDLSSFDFRTGKMLMSKLNKNRQRLRYDNNNQNKVRQQRLDAGLRLKSDSRHSYNTEFRRIL